MKTVLTYGTFDMFHVGHVRLLKRAAELGDQLIVGCSSDDFNSRKGKCSVFSYQERREILLSCRYVHKVIPEESWDQKRRDVLAFNVDCFAMGDDWVGKFDFLQDLTKVIYLPRTGGVSTTKVKQLAGLASQEKKQRILRTAHQLVDLLGDL